MPLIRLPLCAASEGCGIERGWSGSSVAPTFYSGESIDQARDEENRGPVDFSDSPLDWFRGSCLVWSLRRYWIEFSVGLLGVSGLLEFGEME